MKIYKKIFSECNDCPSMEYIHFDGEGESSPYQYYDGVCGEKNIPLPFDHIIKEKPSKTYNDAQRIPRRKIPNGVHSKIKKIGDQDD